MELQTYLAIFLALLLCYLYIIISAYFSHKKCNYIHETTVAIFLGVVLGAIIFSLTDLFQDSTGKSLRQIIVLGLLPPMLFQDGYNIKKRKFFQNIMYINLFGTLGTIANLLVVYGILYVFNAYDLFFSVNNMPIKLEVWQILIITSCLCSIDTVVPENIVNPERYPKLFSIIFGESIFKDTIAVTLFDSIINVYQKLSSAGALINASTVGFLAWKFLEVIACSVMIGTCCALVSTFLFKKFRFLMEEKGVAEVPLILLTGYAAYILSEWGEFSGVISMLFCGITLSHFNIYNMTPQGKSSAKITVSAIAKVTEGLLFFMLGAFIFGIQISQESDKTVDYTFSYTLLLVTILALILGRFANVYLMSLLGYLVVGADKWRLNVYEYHIIAISGMVKGVIPFALVISIPFDVKYLFSNASLQNAIITVVFITSFFLNSIMPKILRFLLNKIDDMIRANKSHPSLLDSFLIEIKHKEEESAEHKREESMASDRSQQSRESEIVEKIQSQKQLQKMAFHLKLKNTTQKYWRRCEQGFLKPLLIHDYHNRKQEIKKEKIAMRKLEVEEFWKQFRGQCLDDQAENKLIDVQLAENDSSSEEEQNQEMKQELPQNTKERSKTNMEMELEITQIKLNKSKTEIPTRGNETNVEGLQQEKTEHLGNKVLKQGLQLEKPLLQIRKKE